MEQNLRLAHFSDVHLDKDTVSSDLMRNTFDNLLKEVLAHNPSLLLIAGDLFDSNEASDDTIKWVMEKLSNLFIPVVMIPGNHDCLEEGSVYYRYDFNLVPNVDFLFQEDGSLIYIASIEVSVWGKGIKKHDKSFRPLKHCPARAKNSKWYVGLGHGLFIDDESQVHRASPILIEDIDNCDCDYLALGHHHAAVNLQSASTTAVYSGSPTDDIGGGATYVVADLTQYKKPDVKIFTL